MGRLNFLGVIALFLTCLSCREDPFSQIIEVEVPPHESRITVNSLLTDIDDVFSLELTQSQGILNNDALQVVNDATVRLLSNGSMLGHFQSIDQAGNYQFRHLNLEFFEELTIEIESPSLGLAQASDEVVSRVSIDAATYERNARTNLERKLLDLLTIYFSDPPDQKNYYGIELIVFTELGYVTDLGDSLEMTIPVDAALESVNPLFEESDNWGLVISDATFADRLAQLEVLVDYRFPQVKGVYDRKVSHLVVRLHNLSENAYLYDRSLNTYREANGNPFAEPVTVHSNVENGYGIFTVIRTSQLVLKAGD